jgi:hypothetical protein
MNVIDLANINSCSFCLKIWAKKSQQLHWDVLVFTDIRGCNLMVLKLIRLFV